MKNMLKLTKERVLKLLEKNGELICEINSDLKNDRDVVLMAFKTAPFTALFHTDVDYTDDKELMLAAVSQFPNMIFCASPRLQYDGDMIDCVLNKEPSVLEEYNFELYSDRFMRVVQHSPFIVTRYNLQSYKHVKEIIKVSPEAWAYIRNSVMCYAYDIVIYALQGNAYMLNFIIRDYIDDPIIVLTAITNDGCRIQHANDTYKNNRAVAYTAIKNDCSAINFVGVHLWVDYEIALFVMCNRRVAHASINNVFLTYPEFVLSTNYVGLKNWCSEITCFTDKEFTMRAIRHDVELLKHASLECRSDYDIILASKTLKYASDELKENRLLKSRFADY